MPKKTKKPELKVIFDTNALYTQTASDLVRPEVAEIITDNSNHPDLTVSFPVK